MTSELQDLYRSQNETLNNTFATRPLTDMNGRKVNEMALTGLDMVQSLFRSSLSIYTLHRFFLEPGFQQQ